MKERLGCEEVEAKQQVERLIPGMKEGGGTQG